MFRRLLHRLHLRYSPSVALADTGRAMAADWARGFEQSDRRRAELLASGLTADEAHVVLLREAVFETDPAVFAYAEGVARRAFWTLYEDDED